MTTQFLNRDSFVRREQGRIPIAQWSFKGTPTNPGTRTPCELVSSWIQADPTEHNLVLPPIPGASRIFGEALITGPDIELGTSEAEGFDYIVDLANTNNNALFPATVDPNISTSVEASCTPLFTADKRMKIDKVRAIVGIKSGSVSDWTDIEWRLCIHTSASEFVNSHVADFGNYQTAFSMFLAGTPDSWGVDEDSNTTYEVEFTIPTTIALEADETYAFSLIARWPDATADIGIVESASTGDTGHYKIQDETGALVNLAVSDHDGIPALQIKCTEWGVTGLIDGSLDIDLWWKPPGVAEPLLATPPLFHRFEVDSETRTPYRLEALTAGDSDTTRSLVHTPGYEYSVTYNALFDYDAPADMEVLITLYQEKAIMNQPLDPLEHASHGGGSSTITEGDVTAHEAALSITESQITDLDRLRWVGEWPGFDVTQQYYENDLLAYGGEAFVCIDDFFWHGVSFEGPDSYPANFTSLTGLLSVIRGGTGRNSATQYALIAGGTGTIHSAHQSLATGTAGQLLKSSGSSALPEWVDDDKASASDLTTHISDTANPHSVTKAQVGLEDVDNTADADKPISTAAQAAFDDKADSVHTHTESDITDLGAYLTDYTVTESDVTAHEAALSITESQITDLDKYTQAEVDSALALKADLSALVIELYAGQFESPANADWSLSVPAAIVLDPDNAAHVTREFLANGTVAVGFGAKVRTGSTSLRIKFIGKAASAPGATNNKVEMQLRYRKIGDDAAIGSWTTVNLGVLTIPNNVNYQHDTIDIDLGAGGGEIDLDAGDEYLFQISRRTGITNNMTQEYLLYKTELTWL